MKNKILKYSLWSVAVILVILVLSFVAESRSNQIMDDPKINIEHSSDFVFLTNSDVMDRLKLNHLLGPNMTSQELMLDSIEHFVNQMNEVDSADVYSKLGGVWHIDINLRCPIARVINKDGSQYYLDQKGELMSLSNLFTANVVPVSGDFNFWEEISLDTNGREIHNDTLITIGKLSQIYRLTSYVCNDTFLSAQIVQIYLDQNGDFVLIPRVGSQKIILGKVENLKRKFRKLKVFYKEGIGKVGWEKYETINLKFADQVVCTKR